MLTMSIQDAEKRFFELIRNRNSEGPILITDDDQPIAMITPAPSQKRGQKRQLDTMRGSILYMAPDFDETPEEFRDYMV